MPYRTTCDPELIAAGDCTAWDDPPTACRCMTAPPTAAQPDRTETEPEETQP